MNITLPASTEHTLKTMSGNTDDMVFISFLDSHL